jgi:hypothetical protein
MQDFAHITSSPTLEKISKETLRSLISSDFVQVSSFSQTALYVSFFCGYPVLGLVGERLILLGF